MHDVFRNSVLLAWVACLLMPPAASAADQAEAEQQSKKTGRPMLALAGSQT